MHFGAARGGAVLTHFSYRMTPQEMAALARIIGVTALFVDPLLMQLARSVLSLVPEIRTVVSLAGATEGAIAFDEFLGEATAIPPDLELRRGRAACDHLHRRCRRTAEGRACPD